jgi:hypothetical protein
VEEEILPEEVDSGTADFSVYVTLGNSLTAGYQSGALYESTQQYGYARLLSQSMGVTSFEMPWMMDPGIYSTEVEGLPGVGHLQLVFDEEGNASIAPTPWPEGVSDPAQFLLNAGLLAPYHNLGIPGSTAYDLYFATISTDCFTGSFLGEPNSYFDSVLRNGTGLWTALGQDEDYLSVVEQTILASPTFLSLWIGNNELLMPATNGSGDAFYPATGDGLSMEAIYWSILNDLKTALPDLDMIVANLPYVTSIPFFTAIPWLIVDPDMNPVYDPDTGFPIGLLAEDAADTAYQLVPSDLVCLSASSYISEGMGIPDAILIALLMESMGMDEATATAVLNDPENSPFPLHGQLLPGNLTLVESEKVAILAATDAYNAVIASLAGAFGIPLVDMNALFSEVSVDGLDYNGKHYTTDFVTGGLFSLDGVHPSNIGQAVIAGYFIDKINETYGSNLQHPSLPEVPLQASRYSPLRLPPDLASRLQF